MIALLLTVASISHAQSQASGAPKPEWPIESNSLENVLKSERVFNMKNTAIAEFLDFISVAISEQSHAIREADIKQPRLHFETYVACKAIKVTTNKEAMAIGVGLSQVMKANGLKAIIGPSTLIVTDSTVLIDITKYREIYEGVFILK